MPNPRLASRYAKSLIDLSVERNQLELVYADMKYLQAVCKASKEFMNFLFSPIIKADKKEAIITAVTKGNIGVLTEAFVKLLITKGRESDLYEIAGAFVSQYNDIKGIHTVKLTTAVAISDSLKQSIQAKVNTSQPNGSSIELEAKVDEKLIGGFVLEFDNKLVDASVLRDLNDVKKQFLKNYYVQAMR
ncbi:MAG: ATP synthase F1 subunit delta [Pedobacter sp.]|nr:ATP synthase F1 subunit delta [Chitinophagaceae bacterium]